MFKFKLTTPFKFLSELVTAKIYDKKVNEVETLAHEYISTISNVLKEPLVREHVVKFTSNYGKDIKKACDYMQAGQTILEELGKQPKFKSDLSEMVKLITETKPNEKNIQLQILQLMCQDYLDTDSVSDLQSKVS